MHCFSPYRAIRSFSRCLCSLYNKQMNKERFGEKIAFAEPYWYQGYRSSYYRETHIAFRNKVRAFVEKEIFPYE